MPVAKIPNTPAGGPHSIVIRTFGAACSAWGTGTASTVTSRMIVAVPRPHRMLIPPPPRPLSGPNPAAFLLSAGHHGRERSLRRRAIEVRLRLARRREEPRRRVVSGSGHQQLLRREARDHLAADFRHDELFLDARGRPAVRRRPERFQGEYHPIFDHLRMVEGDQPAEDGLLPDGQADSVAVLQREGGLLVGEAELRGPGP